MSLHADEADYDLSRRFTRTETLDLLDQARRATQHWHAVRGHPIAQLFLLALLAKTR